MTSLADAVSGSGALIAQVLLSVHLKQLSLTLQPSSALPLNGRLFDDERERHCWLLISGEPSSEEEAMEFLEAIVEISAECGLEDVFGLSDISSD